MRAHVGVSACAHSVRSSDRQARLRSLVLLPAMVVTAAAMHAPAAFARPSVQWDEGAGPRFHTERNLEERDDDEARPRRHSSGRSHAGARRRCHRQARAGKSRHTRSAATGRSARRNAPPQKHATAARHVIPRLAAANPVPEIVPLEQRSLVAAHPLAPDPILTAPALGLAFDPAPLPQAAAPRCKTAHPSSFALAVASFERGFQPSEPSMVEGAWPHCRGARNPQSSLRLASLGPMVSAPDPTPSLSGGSIHWRASDSCLASPLRDILGLVASNFGPLTVNSTCRSRSHNARVGGASRSMHLTGNAVDFRVRGRYGDVLAFLLRQRGVGGYKHYGSGVFHIDTGPRRTWGARRARA